MAEIPKDGFIKLIKPGKINIDFEKKVQLIRKGNQLFNSGDIETAKKIFVTIGYQDGIIRTGDYYYSKQNYWEAYRMYKLAPSPEKAEYLAKRMSEVIREWINE